MSTQPRYLNILLGGVVALVLPGSVFAAPVTLAQVGIVFDGIANYSNNGTSTASLDRSAVSTSSLSTANATAFAGAEVGHLRAYVDGATLTTSGGLSDNLGQTITARPRSITRFSDGVTFASAGLTGQLVTVSASLLFDGFLSTTAAAANSTPGVSGGGAASARSEITVQIVGTGLSTNLGLGGDFGAIARAAAFDPTGTPVNVNLEIPIVVPVLFTARIGSSTPIQYLMDMQGFGQSSVFRNSAILGSASSSFVGDYSGSLTWGGITSVTNAAGNVISDYTALGEGGFDYRNAAPAAVPAPSTFVLLLSGGMMVWLRRGRAKA